MGICDYCGEEVPIMPETDTLTGKVLNDPDDAQFIGFNMTAIDDICSNPRESESTDGVGVRVVYTEAQVVAWCDGCVHPVSRTIATKSWASHMEDNVAAMRLADWLVLAFATCESPCRFSSLPIAKLVF